MSKLRFLVDYGTYHVYNRGHNKMTIFKDSQDKDVFLGLLRKAQLLFNFQIFAYCLMLNHYHLLFKDTGKQLPAAIGWIQQNYAIYFNAKYNHCGAVFMKPFKSKLILDKAHFFTEVCYILNNPVKAEMVSVFNEYKWNSPITGYEKYNITDYLYLQSYYDPVNGMSLSEYIHQRSRSKRISSMELERLPDNEAKILFDKIVNTFSNYSKFSVTLISNDIQNKVIEESLYQGITSRQLYDFTGISKSSILRKKSERSYI